MKWDKLSEEKKREIAFKRLSRTNPIVWIITVLLWLAVNGTLLYFLITKGMPAAATHEKILQVLYYCCVLFFTFHVFIEIMRLPALLLTDKRYKRYYECVKNVSLPEKSPKVLLICCTFNDFCERPLKLSIQQKYDDFETIILDDSTKPEYRKAVDEFAAANNIQVVRREVRKDFKAGALNDYLLSVREPNSYDYFVVMDADDILPENYITEILKCFYVSEKIGAVQAAHASVSNRNFFMKAFSLVQTGFSFLDRAARARFGCLFDIGHSIMFRKEAFETTGGFPKDILLEDVAISLEMKQKGLTVFYAPHVVCGEESPVNFVAHKKRASKWGRGDIGLLKRYFFRVCFSKKMKVHEKLDIIRAPFMTSVVTLFIFFIAAVSLVSVILGGDLYLDKYVSLFLTTPIIYPFIVYLYTFGFNKTFFSSFFKVVITLIITCSSFITMFFSALLGFFNLKLAYNVTPKENEKITFWRALRYCTRELFIGFLLCAGIVVLLVMSLGSVSLLSITMPIMFIACMLISPFICLLSNTIYSDEKMDKVDKEILRYVHKHGALSPSCKKD